MTRVGKSRTPASARSLPRSTPPLSREPLPASCAVTASKNAMASLALSPMTVSVSNDADATEMAQPEPSKAASLIVWSASTSR